MSEIELVIKIPEGIYEHIKNTWRKRRGSYPESCIAWGIPLPKGHGDLIDRTKICKAIPAEEDNCTGMGMTYNEMNAYNDGIEAMYNIVQGVKPIIEADKDV